MRRLDLLHRIPIIRHWIARRRLAAIRADQLAMRQQAAETSAAVARMLAQAPHCPDPWRSYR